MKSPSTFIYSLITPHPLKLTEFADAEVTASVNRFVGPPSVELENVAVPVTGSPEGAALAVSVHVVPRKGTRIGVDAARPTFSDTLKTVGVAPG